MIAQWYILTTTWFVSCGILEHIFWVEEEETTAPG